MDALGDTRNLYWYVYFLGRYLSKAIYKGKGEGKERF